MEQLSNSWSGAGRRRRETARFSTRKNFKTRAFTFIASIAYTILNSPTLDAYQQFLTIGRTGLVVGDLDANRKLELNKQAYAYQIAFSAAFREAFDALGNADFADALFARAGVTPTVGERSDLINGLNNGTLSRADVLLHHLTAN